MKLILIIIFGVLLGCGDKVKNFGNCSLLIEAISSEHTQREFFLCKDDTQFVLYDKNGIFENCTQLKVCEKEVVISQDKKYDELSPNDNRSTKDKSIIILHKVEKVGANHKLYFWRPYSGAVVNLTFRQNGRKFELADYVIGTL